ncbi:outer membrane beta-barrel protein [candidate division KSB1 bacterium]|nr:outer membrane beta-barrel protein [candidate division KSB1 bacterium]
MNSTLSAVPALEVIKYNYGNGFSLFRKPLKMFSWRGLMRFSYRWIILFFGFLIIIPSAGRGQLVGDWAIGAASTYSRPVGGLSDWFQSAMSAEVSAGQQYNDQWFIGGIVSYNRFDHENLSGYPAGKIELLLEHYELLVSGRYAIAKTKHLRPYLNIAAGLYHWKGKRGEIEADSSVTPFVPHIDAKELTATNWGFRTGIGIEIRLSSMLAVDVLGYYRFIVGDLWPTMQPNIELEGVSGFQTLNLSLGIRYHF